MSFSSEHSPAHTACVEGKAFEHAFEQYWARLYHHALRKLNDQELAEDLVQECFIVLWNNCEILLKPDELGKYLYGVLRHKILDVFRKDQVRLRYADRFASLPKEFADSADKRIILSELQKVIDDELALMPARMVEIYRLKREQKLSTSEIAQMLGISEQTVKNQSYRAAERLKQCIIAYDSSLLILGISLLIRIRV